MDRQEAFSSPAGSREARIVVLLAGGDPALREAAARALPRGCALVWLPGADEAVETVEAYEPDVIFVDGGVSAEDVLRLSRRLRARSAFRAIPVVRLPALFDAGAFRRSLERRTGAGCPGAEREA